MQALRHRIGVGGALLQQGRHLLTNARTQRAPRRQPAQLLGRLLLQELQQLRIGLAQRLREPERWHMHAGRRLLEMHGTSQHLGIGGLRAARGVDEIDTAGAEPRLAGDVACHLYQGTDSRLVDQGAGATVLGAPFQHQDVVGVLHA